MHLLIDVRTSCLSDIPHLSYAEMWADLWLSYHTDDRITFLAFEGDPVERYECIFLSRGWKVFPKKIAHHRYGPDRIISFSKYPPIDTSIPAIIHIDELTHHIYPHAHETSLSRYLTKRRYKKNIHHASHIIVPERSMLDSLLDIYSADESKISILPYLSPTDGESYRAQTLLPHGIAGDFFITEGTPGDEWNPRGLLEAYHTYITEKNGKNDLLILGDMGKNLSPLSIEIRSLGLTGRVKIVGILSSKERSLLYTHAKGWIYIGHYYSRSASIELASAYGLPLYLSEIPVLRSYSGKMIHPNHIDTLPDILAETPPIASRKSWKNNEEIMRAYTRIVSD